MSYTVLIYCRGIDISVGTGTEDSSGRGSLGACRVVPSLPSLCPPVLFFLKLAHSLIIGMNLLCMP